MLHKEIVSPELFGLIRSLQSDEHFTTFHLAGGTALAFQIGHRISVDLDLFTTEDFDVNTTLEHLERSYGFSLQFSEKNTLKGIIDGVFVDFITHQYPLIGDLAETDGIRLFAMSDIAAMKVNAIAGDGTRIKDFIDIYFLLKHFSFSDIIGYYRKKYNQRNDFHAVKSICYFDDIDRDQDWPQMLKEKDLTLRKIKEAITRSKDDYITRKLKLK